MQVVERPVAVALQGIVGADHVAVGIQPEILAGVVPVFEIVLRRPVEHARRRAPPADAVGHPQELVEGRERPDALHVAHAPAPFVHGCGRQGHGAAQAAARDPHRAGAVEHLGIVDEIGGDQREVDLPEHGRVDPHAVPRDLRVRRSRAAERGRGHRRPAVGFDEERRARGQRLGQRRGDRLVEHGAVHHRTLDADACQRPARRDLDPLDVERIGRRIALRRRAHRGERCQQKGYAEEPTHVIRRLRVSRSGSGSSGSSTLRSRSPRSAAPDG